MSQDAETELPALIERLREDGRQLNAIFPDRLALSTEAADALTTAQAEIASLRSLLAVAEGALEPFAKAGESDRVEGAEDSMPLEDAFFRDEQPSVGDLRRASAALTAIRAAKDAPDAS